MNKRQKEVELAKLADEKKELNKLNTIYKQATKDIINKIRILDEGMEVYLKDIDNLDEIQMSALQSKIYQKKYQNQLLKQLDDMLKDLDEGQYESIKGYLDKSYKTGFMGALYDIHGQGIPLILPLDQKRVAKAMALNPKINTSLYKMLGENVSLLKKRIANNISRGFATADSFKNIARNIARGSNIGLNKAMRIVRTEGHRVQIDSAMDALYGAADNGAEVVKQWDAALDGKTRPTHRMLDGQIRELDEPFEVAGTEVEAPSRFGIAAEDINCRCAVLQRATWALDESELQTLKDRAAFHGLDKTKDFDDFQKKYLKAEGK